MSSTYDPENSPLTPECFTLTWKIENVSLFKSAKHGEFLTLLGPVLKTMHVCGSANFQLNVRSKNDNDQGGTYVFHLRFLGGCEFRPTLNKWRVTLLSSCGEVLATESNNVYDPEMIVETFGCDHLSQDTLTVCCSILGTRPGQCEFRSVLQRVDLLWNIEPIQKFIEPLNYSLHRQGTLQLMMTMTSYRLPDPNSTVENSRVVVAALPNNEGWPMILDYELSIDPKYGQIGSQNNTTLCAEITPSWDIRYFRPCRIIPLQLNALIAVQKEYKTVDFTGLGSSVGCSVSSSSLSTLSGELLLLYNEGTLSDVKLNTEGKSLSAHRSILAARSSVFRAMFEKDEMNEARSGVVDIKDVDSETMERMLVFMYGDSFEDLQWEEASALYEAADKYAVLPLKHRCADILKAGLSVSNVCDALVLADAHSDQELTKCTVDFIYNHDEVVSSSDWEKLESNHLLLASKTMRHLYLKRGKK